MDEFHVGDIVEYVDYYIPDKQWYLYSISSNNLCAIVAIRDGMYMHEKHFSGAGHKWTEKYLNASVVNLDISRIKKRG